MTKISYLLVAFNLIFILLFSEVQANKFRAQEKRLLDYILRPEIYDKRIRPSGFNVTEEGPTFVSVNFFIRSIGKIDDYQMDYKLQLTFRQEWYDDRLKFDDSNGNIKYLTLTEVTRVWMPDLYFSNEKDGHSHEIVVPNTFVRIHSNGQVLYSLRISLTLSCPMNLKLFPMDRQVCSMKMASFGWTTDDLVFLWKNNNPVQIPENLKLSRFTLENHTTGYCDSLTNTGKYSCLQFDMMLKRDFSYYLIQIYIPCCMFVMISWVSFWLGQEGAITARTVIGVTTLLTMATKSSSVNASLPPVSYVKAIDVWTGTCLTFIFAAFLEFACVNCAQRSEKRKEKMAIAQAQQKKDDDVGILGSILPGDKELNKEKVNGWWRKLLLKYPNKAKRLDIIARIVFPLLFLIFNIVYWTTYLSMS